MRIVVSLIHHVISYYFGERLIQFNKRGCTFDAGDVAVSSPVNHCSRASGARWPCGGTNCLLEPMLMDDRRVIVQWNKQEINHRIARIATWMRRSISEVLLHDGPFVVLWSLQILTSWKWVILLCCAENQRTNYWIILQCTTHAGRHGLTRSFLLLLRSCCWESMCGFLPQEISVMSVILECVFVNESTFIVQGNAYPSDCTWIHRVFWFIHTQNCENFDRDALATLDIYSYVLFHSIH